VSGLGERYTCSVCGRDRVKTRSDGEARAEQSATWQPQYAGEDSGLVCGPCFAALMAWVRAEHPEYLR